VKEFVRHHPPSIESAFSTEGRGVADEKITHFGLCLDLRVLAMAPALAQEITGVPGSPSATAAINGERLPAPPEKFGGKIERDATKSKPY
jgi:hypothetical protein